ncbi:MAG TPA: FHA domain-containing protein [Pyrinomonadaceae bacterium]|jgi:hypothetical protein|nr:FHA domain-containing protein [Pyrinomonadaceae bacterium]
MLKATLIVSQPGQATQEVESAESVTHIGSALDNTVCLEPDPGVGRYHAVVERRGDDFWLSDLGTRQGTKVNGRPVLSEEMLRDGDHIALGETCVIEFYRSEVSPPPAETDDSPPTSAGAVASSSSLASNVHSAVSHAGSGSASAGTAAEGMSSEAKVITASAGTAAVVVAAAAFALFNPFGGGCQPSARILTPLNGTVLRSAVTIRVETFETKCIRRLSYELDGQEVTASSTAPYEATLDPSRLTGFAAGSHVLTATVETTDGGAVRQTGEIYVALGGGEAKQVATAAPAPTPEEATAQGGRGPSQPAAADVQTMAERLASQISGKSGYVFERDMTARILALTDEYTAARAAERAARHRRVVVKAFGDRDVRPLLGFLLAMSRSKFEESYGSDLWRMPPGVARGYAPPGEAVPPAAGQQRAAEVAAVYLKDLLGIFEQGNFDLAVACYGCTIEEAGALKQRLAGVPDAERRNFWKLYERGFVRPEQAEQVVRFYAAGIVAENPERFGAAGERTLSSLEY